MIIKGTDRTTLGALLSEFQLTIPPYQRFYEWGDDLWEQLWADVNACIEEKKTLFLGIIFLGGRLNSRTVDVIDGQQRIITSLIFLRALYRSGRLRGQRQRRLGEWLRGRKILADKQSSRLVLNANDADRYFQHVVVKGDGEHLDDVDERRRHIKNIKSGLRFFVEKIRAERRLKRIKAIETFLRDSLEVVTVLIESEFEAFEIFESINSKKADLSIADLTKNLVLQRARKAPEKTYHHAIQKWDALSNRDMFLYGGNEFSRFLKVWWAGTTELVRGKGFFKKFKNSKLLRSSSPLQVVANLSLHADIYERLVSPSDEFWGRSADGKEISGSLHRMKHLGLKTVHPLTMVLIGKLWPKKSATLAQLLVLLETVAFVRVVLKKQRPGPLEVDYSDWAIGISSGRLAPGSVTQKIQRQLSESCRDLVHDMTKTDFENNTVAAYVLLRLLRGKQRAALLTDRLANAAASVEHILPEEPDDWEESIWKEIQRDDKLRASLSQSARTSTRRGLVEQYHRDFCYKLGNLSLLTGSDNSQLGNRGYKRKVAIYRARESGNWLFKSVVSQHAWGQDQIMGRTDDLAHAFESIVRELC